MRKVFKPILMFLILAFPFEVSLAVSDSKTLESKRKKGDRASVSIKKRVRKKANKARPSGPKSNQGAIFATRQEKKLIKGIGRTLRFLSKTSKKLPKKSGARLQMLERMLNLTLEQAAYISSGEQEAYDRRWTAWSDNGGKGKEPKVDNSKSNAHWVRVSALAKAITKEYPKAPNGDEIAFNGALALQFLGKNNDAAREYKGIIKRNPKSPYAGDSYFSLGDYYFDRNDFRRALGYYKSAIKYRRSSRYGWALFKLGWCYYNLNKYSKSLSLWKKTVSHSSKLGGTKGLRLKEEAMRDMIFSFAELQKIDEAIRYYRRNGGDKYIAKLLKLLAQTLTEQGKFRQSIKAWQKLLNYYPASEEAFDAQAEVVALNFEDGNIRQVWNELETLVKNYHPTSRWSRKNGKEAAKNASEETQRLFLYYPKLIHKDAQKSNSKGKFSQAKKGYRLFIKYFPKSKEQSEIKEYLADIDYFQGNFREAGQNYLSIALRGKKNAVIFGPNGKVKENIHKRSSENMLDSYNKDFLPELKGLLKQKPDFRKPPRALSARAKNFIKGCRYYIKWYPGDRKTVKNCETFTGEIYFRTQNKKMATRYLWLLARKYSKQKEGQAAVDNLIPIFQDNPKELASIAKKLLGIPAYRKGKTGVKLSNLLREMKIEQITSVSSSEQRAVLFEKQARGNPKDRDADKFWNNAAVDYLKSGNFSGAMNAYTMIVKRYPRSKLLSNSLLQLGKLYDDILDFSQAATYFGFFANKYPKQKEAPGAMQRACELLIALQSPKAFNTCAAFASKFPAGGVEAIEKLIQSLWRSKQYAAMTKVITGNYLRTFKLSPNQKILAYYKIYRAYGGRGAQGSFGSNGIAQTARAGGNISGEALRYLGEIAFGGIQSLQKQFYKYRLQGGDVNRLQASIELITSKLEGLEKAYQNVFSTQDSYWGIAAFYQLGSSYESFAGQLRSPPAINGVKREDLIKQLQGSVDQILSKAREYYTTGLQTSRRFTIYNQWSGEIFNGLNRIVGRNISFEEIIVVPDFIGSETPLDVKSQLN